MSFPDRTEYVDDILAIIKKLSYKDLRIAQIMEIISKGDDIFYIENDELLKRLKEFEKNGI